MDREVVTGLDEAAILGYFESLRGVFLTKWVVLAALTRDRNGRHILDPHVLPASAIDEAEAAFPDPLFYRAFWQGNAELHTNFLEDMGTALVTSAWNIFELVTKHLMRPDYVLQTGDMSVCYQNARFQFTTREKKDLELFYTIRNALHHYNGAYYAGKSIDHRYAGTDFVSAGHEGEKMPMNLGMAYAIARDLERYTLKAWSCAQLPPPARS